MTNNFNVRVENNENDLFDVIVSDDQPSADTVGARRELAIITLRREDGVIRLSVLDAEGGALWLRKDGPVVQVIDVPIHSDEDYEPSMAEDLHKYEERNLGMECAE